MGFQQYKNKVNRKNGGNVKEYVKKQVSDNLDAYLSNSQYGFDVEINGKTERIAITTNKMSDSYDGVLVLSKPGVLKMGTLFKWDNEFWVVLKRTVRVIKESFYGEAYRCNIELKWVDDDGNLQVQKGYGKGRGFSTVLVENIYTQPPLIMRDVDLPLTIATERNLNFKQDMRFILNGLPYRITAVDNLSIDNMTIIGMYDDIAREGDDFENSVAAYDRYSIVLDFENEIDLLVGASFDISYHFIDNGMPITNKAIIIEVDKELALVKENGITPLKPTDIPVTIKSKQNPIISTNFIIHASNVQDVPENIYVVGLDNLAWNTSALYYLNTYDDAEFIVDFPKKVKGSLVHTDNSVEISIKDKYSGVIKLTANKQDGTTYNKDILIVTNGGE